MLHPTDDTMRDRSRISDGTRFLCDGMLARLCRRLRAAGYDTEIAKTGEHDGALLARAVEEGRILLTCDRKMAERRLARDHVIVLPSNGLDETARALMRRVSVDWLRDPFSRCLLDNARLRLADPEERHRLPPRAREIGSRDIAVCPICGRIYWPGSHFRRMRDQLDAWQKNQP